ncbi:hypothetical protein GIB67_028516 [Kingdonia uniflora]|uniref:Defective in cullin neddylation protein n=1 Tax=Kingdonia uniflora TaxID=39325 RepID=A0A7J7KVV1_9MAGN|nr:hypothetical protein GIB67_028516 [Kingdonia uniflora]
MSIDNGNVPLENGHPLPPLLLHMIYDDKWETPELEWADAASTFSINFLVSRLCFISGWAIFLNEKFPCGALFIVPYIVSGEGRANSKEAVAELLKLVDLRGFGSLILNDLWKLMTQLNSMVGSCEFARLYDFVFFICRENGQKSIPVSRAITAWQIVLKGRFRLINEWCNFVERHQRNNISEDTWQQVLAFSRCVHEDLEGYDTQGAWPVLIDEFVEYMHRTTQSKSCSTCSFGFNSEDQREIAVDTFPGLKVFSGLKRKAVEASNSMSSDQNFSYKRIKETDIANKLDDMEITKHAASLVSSNNFGCAAEGSSSKGFAGLLSTGHC